MASVWVLTSVCSFRFSVLLFWSISLSISFLLCRKFYNPKKLILRLLDLNICVLNSGAPLKICVITRISISFTLLFILLGLKIGSNRLSFFWINKKKISSEYSAIRRHAQNQSTKRPEICGLTEEYFLLFSEFCRFNLCNYLSAILVLLH